MSGAADGLSWLQPGGSDSGRGLFATYSLILATFLGTMGLPHVLVRFYTNPESMVRPPDVPRWSFSALLGPLHLLPTLYGVLGRVYAPQLVLSG